MSQRKRTIHRPVKNYRKPEIKVQTLDAAVKAWFAGRKITQTTLDRFKIRMAADGRIAFPYYKAATCVNVKYRKLPKEFTQEKDCEPVLFGRDLVPVSADHLLVVEGEMDALAAWEYGIVAVSVPGGTGNTQWISTEWEWLKQFKQLDLALDNDPAGEAGVSAIQKRMMMDWELRRVELPAKDFNDALMAGITAEQIKSAIDKARPIRPEEIKLLRDIDFSSVDAPDPGTPCEIAGLTGEARRLAVGRVDSPRWGRVCGKEHSDYAGSRRSSSTIQEACVCNLEQKLSTIVWTLIQQSGMTREDFLRCYADELFFSTCTMLWTWTSCSI